MGTAHTLLENPVREQGLIRLLAREMLTMTS